MKIHPDDIDLFEKVKAVMEQVARDYELPLKSITPHPNPEAPSWLGTCDSGGNITVVMRFTQHGEWTEPRREVDIWNTAAHELAHLRYLNHSAAFQAFEEEMQQAIAINRDQERSRLIRKLQKLKAQSEGEAAIGNTAAAETFAAVLNRMLLEHELRPSDLEYQRDHASEPIIELHVDFASHGLEAKRARQAWQESLASVVARNHLCRILIRPRSNSVWFVGTRPHALVAEYTYGVLVKAAWDMSLRELLRYRKEVRRTGQGPSAAYGFRAAWLDAFINRIDERLQQQLNSSVHEFATAAAGTMSQTTALLRIDVAKQRVDDYLDAKFGRKHSYAGALNGGRKGHAVGRARGSQAADSLSIHKPISSGARRGATRGMLNG